ncbi:unnamed protein product, partial [Prorocentrum cordatum]
DAVALSRQARGLQEALREAQQSAPRPHDPAGSLGGATPALPAEALQERGWAEAAEAAEARLAAAQAAGPPRERGWPEVEDAAAPAGQPARPVGGARRWEEEEPLLAALDAGSAAAAAAGPWAFLPASPPPGDAEAEADALLANATEAPAETSTGKPPLERDPLSSADKAAICGEDAQFECSRVTEILTLGYRLSAFWSVVAWAVAGVLLGTCCCCGLACGCPHRARCCARRACRAPFVPLRPATAGLRPQRAPRPPRGASARGRARAHRRAGAPRATAIAEEGPEEKVLRAFFSWLLPDVRNQRGNCSKDVAHDHRWWDRLWASFKASDSMDWPTFDAVIPWDCKMGPQARRIFDILDDGSGMLTKHSLLSARRHHERTLVVSKPNGLEALRKMLMQRYSGSLMMGWRAVLDPTHRGFTSHAEFVKACKGVGFAGDLKESWKQLTGGAGRRRRPGSSSPEAQARAVALWREGVCSSALFGDLTARESKILFAALDLDYNKLVDVDAWNFLAVYDTRTAEEAAEDGRGERPDRGAQTSGSLSGSRCGSTARLQGAPAAGAVSAWHGEGADGTTSFEFVVVLTREEHAEYQRRRRERAAEKKAHGRLQGLTGGYPSSPPAAPLEARPVPASWSLPSPRSPPGSPRASGSPGVAAAAPAAEGRPRPEGGPLSGLLRAM